MDAELAVLLQKGSAQRVVAGGTGGNRIVGGTKPDFVTEDPTATSPSPLAQFTPVLLSSGSYALKADTGLYLGVCSACSPSSTKPNSVTVHVADPNNEPWGQWNIIWRP